MKTLILFLVSVTTFATPYSFPEDFFFGVANAPGHVEDQLDDIWLDFAKNGHVRAYHNQYSPEKRLQFWSKPEIEIKLAKELGIQVIRIGIDWNRIEPKEGQIDEKALNRYLEIFKLIKENDLKIMLTLFHHSEPKWMLKKKSWLYPKAKTRFYEFSKIILENAHPYIDYLITFNEANVYLLLGMVDGLWPSPFESGSYFRFLNLGLYKGPYYKAFDQIIMAHKSIYQLAKKYNIPTGVAHNFAKYKADNILLSPMARIFNSTVNFEFIDQIKDHQDFIGVNYYGKEFIGFKGPSIRVDREYSEAGRSISPQSFNQILNEIQIRYDNTPVIITENGIADNEDYLRPSYLLSHLKVLSERIKLGQKILGYIHWTLTDNWEWADGYCPKFGLVSVDRKTMERTKRYSFSLYRQIILNKQFDDFLINEEWSRLKSNWNLKRSFCRSLKDGKTPLDEATMIHYKKVDWKNL